MSFTVDIPTKEWDTQQTSIKIMEKLRDSKCVWKDCTENAKFISEDLEKLHCGVHKAR